MTFSIMLECLSNAHTWNIRVAKDDSQHSDTLEGEQAPIA
jgi:hypothetical protein